MIYHLPENVFIILYEKTNLHLIYHIYRNPISMSGIDYFLIHPKLKKQKHYTERYSDILK